MKKRDILIVVGALCAAVILTVAQLYQGAIPTGAWGLSFGPAGQAPSGPASSSQLAKYDGVYMGSPDEKVLYLTFDAGYENGYTADILDILKKHNVPAAFFLTGNYLEKNADLVRRMVDEGHIVGNHTYHHYDMSKLQTLQAFSGELEKLEGLFAEITGKQLPRFYRPPQGIYSEENLKMAQQLGYKTVFWSLAYADWDVKKQPTESFAMEKLTGRIHNGAILLLHSTSKTNAAILDRLLTELKQQGYTFRSIDSLFI